MEIIRSLNISERCQYHIFGGAAHRTPQDDKYINEIVRTITEEFSEEAAFTLAGIGLSGALICGAVAFQLRSKGYQYFNVTIVRKPEDTDSHYKSTIFHKDIFILDDFICSGKTLSNLVISIKNHISISSEFTILDELNIRAFTSDTFEWLTFNDYALYEGIKRNRSEMISKGVNTIYAPNAY